MRSREPTLDMPVIGLTGGIATGKSTVGQLLRNRGAVVFSADEIAHAIATPGSPVVRRIGAELGAQFVRPDGSLDRARLGALVFSDKVARLRLEAITHPVILAELRQRIAEALAANPDALVVAEVPLLFETGLDDWFDAVLTVVAPADVECDRLIARAGLSREAAERRIASQMPLSEKQARSQFVIQNDGTLEELTASVSTLVPRLLAVDKRALFTL